MQTKRRLAVSDYEAPGGDVVEVIGVEDLLTSPGTSYWLRDAISSSMKRCPTMPLPTTTSLTLLIVASSLE